MTNHLRVCAPLSCLLLFSVVTCGCVTIQSGSDTADPVGNLRGDGTRSYLDIVNAGIECGRETYTFSVTTAAPFPNPQDMKDKRLDLIWFVDVDRDTYTGQTHAGNDHNIHLFLDGDGWHTRWHKVSPIANFDGVKILEKECRFSVHDNKAEVTFPKRYLATPEFDWWAASSTKNSPNWSPETLNPPTVKKAFYAN